MASSARPAVVSRNATELWSPADCYSYVYKCLIVIGRGEWWGRYQFVGVDKRVNKNENLYGGSGVLPVTPTAMTTVVIL